MSEFKMQELDLDTIAKISGGGEKPKEWITYHVQAGDTLRGIAQRYMCTVKDLKSWNDLTSDTVDPWMILNIYTINY